MLHSHAHHSPQRGASQVQGGSPRASSPVPSGSPWTPTEQRTTHDAPRRTQSGRTNAPPRGEHTLRPPARSPRRDSATAGERRGDLQVPHRGGDGGDGGGAG